MALTSDTLQRFLVFWQTIEAAVDCEPNGLPPSAVARVKGTLTNFQNQMKALLAQLETREPAPKDEADLAWIVRTLETLRDDKWVNDGWAGKVVDWHGTKTAEAIGLTLPPTPLTLQSALGMLLQGLADLKAD